MERDIPVQSQCDQANTRRRSFLKALTGVGAAGMVGIAGCVGGDSTEIEFNIPTGEDSVQGQTPQLFKEGIEERVDTVEIKLFFDGELGGQLESFEGLSTGSLDMFITSYSLAGGQFEPIQIYDAPYLYDDYDHLLEATNPEETETTRELTEEMVNKTDIRILGSVIQGTRVLTLNDEPAYHPDDLEGREVRAVPIDITFEAVNGLGANAVDIDWSEVPTAISSGSVDGQENPYNIFEGAGIHDMQDYCMETNHIDMPLPLYISEQTWTKLSDEEKDAFKEAIDDLRDEAIDLLEDIEDPARERVAEKMEIIEPDELDMDAFRSRSRQHIRETFPEWVDLIEDVHGGSYE